MIWLVGIVCGCIGIYVGYITCALLSVNKIVDITERKTQKKGIWKISPDGYYPYCSYCGYEPEWVIGKDSRTRYCSNCGAEMTKEVK